jgi:hypothetical protein
MAYFRQRGLGQSLLNPGGVFTNTDPVSQAMYKLICGNFPDTPGCTQWLASQQAQQVTAPPTLAPGSVSPGLPVGYNPQTGAVAPSNVTGQTQVTPYQATLPAGAGDQGDQTPTCDDSTFSGWLCCNLGIGCQPGQGTGTPTWVWAVGATLAGVVLLNALGGRR